MTENFYFNFAYSMNGKKSKYHDMFCRVTVPSGPDTSKVSLEKFSRYRKGRCLRGTPLKDIEEYEEPHYHDEHDTHYEQSVRARAVDGRIEVPRIPRHVK